jgi:hypothetical protein
MTNIYIKNNEPDAYKGNAHENQIYGGRNPRKTMTAGIQGPQLNLILGVFGNSYSMAYKNGAGYIL